MQAQGYLKSSTMSLTKGMSPILWQRNSSWRTEVFSAIETRCVARVGTYEMMILLNALARLTSHPATANRMYSVVSSIISTVIFSMILWINQIIILNCRFHKEMLTSKLTKYGFLAPCFNTISQPIAAMVFSLYFDKGMQLYRGFCM